MPEEADRRHTIGEVSELTGVAVHLLRQWEQKTSVLKPKRDRNNRRYYTLDDINVVRELNHLVRHRKMTLRGASLHLAKKLHGQEEPENRQEIIELVDKIEGEVRAMLRLLDGTRSTDLSRGKKDTRPTELQSPESPFKDRANKSP